MSRASFAAFSFAGVNGVPGVKYDLGNGGWDSLGVYVDGKVYPTAALVNEPALLCGDTTERDLAQILESSAVIRRLREASVALRPGADAEVKVTTRGPDGKPVAAEVTLAVVDEGVGAAPEPA